MIEVVQCLPIGMLPTEFGVKLVAATPTPWREWTSQSVTHVITQVTQPPLSAALDACIHLPTQFLTPLSECELVGPELGDTLFDDDKETRST